MKLNATNSILIFIFTINIYLIFLNVNQVSFWNDEAWVVWNAKNYNQFNSFVEYDGANLLLLETKDISKFKYNFTILHPKIDIYITSLVLKYVSIEDELKIRYLFAFLSGLCLIFYVLLIKSIFNDPVEIIFSYGAFSLSTIYILISQNVRYYIILMFLGVLFLYLSKKYLDATKHKLLLLFLIFLCQILLLFTHYSSGISFNIAVVFYFLFNARKKGIDKDTFKYFAVFVLSLSVFVFYYYSQKIYLLQTMFNNSDSLIVKVVKQFVWSLYDFNRSCLFPFVFILLTIYFLHKKRFDIRIKSIIYSLCLFLTINFIISPQSTNLSKSLDIRYFYNTHIFFSLIIGSVLALIYRGSYRFSKPIAILALIIHLNFSLFNFDSDKNFIYPTLSNYVVQKFDHNYTTPNSILQTYISEKINKPFSFSCYPQFNSFVLINSFYNRAYLSHSVDSIPRKFLTQSTKKYLYNFTPDFVFVYGKEIHTFRKNDTLYQKYRQVGQVDVYSDYMDYSRPELYWHKFETQRCRNTDENLKIFKRVPNI